MSDELEDMLGLGDAMESFNMDDAQETNAKLEGKAPIAKKKGAHHYRWRKFVREYLKNGNNAAQAYMTTYGIEDNRQAASCAGHLMERPEIIKLIEEQRDHIAAKCDIDLQENARLLHQLIDTCLEDGDKHHLTKALDMLNKMAGGYTQKVEHKHEGITFNFIRPTDSE